MAPITCHVSVSTEIKWKYLSNNRPRAFEFYTLTQLVTSHLPRRTNRPSSSAFKIAALLTHFFRRQTLSYLELVIIDFLSFDIYTRVPSNCEQTILKRLRSLLFCNRHWPEVDPFVDINPYLIKKINIIDIKLHSLGFQAAADKHKEAYRFDTLRRMQAYVYVHIRLNVLHAM
jgi:hypothetical protein